MTTEAPLDEREALDRLLGTVADAMHPEVLVLDADMTGDLAARRLEERGVSGAPVLRDGRVVGVVTLRDLFTAIALDQAMVRSTGPFLRHERLLADYRLDQLMTRQPATAQADWPLVQGVVLMVELGVNRLPVVDDDGRPVGILARDDVLRAVAERARRRREEPGRPRLRPD